MSTTIIMVRHAEVHNPTGILYGRLPGFGLSRQGRREAEVTASVLAEEPVSVFYTSPQLRARQTAAVLRSPHPNAPLHVSGLLAEVLTGWQGRSHAELEQIGFNLYEHRLNPEDESLEELWARIQRFFGRVRRKHAGEEVVAVTHGDLCNLARAAYCGLPIEVSSIRRPHPYPGHGSLTRFNFSDDPATTYPLSVEYYDPNGRDPVWSRGWATMEMRQDAA